MSLFYDVWFLQFFIIYIVYLVFINTNVYYTLLYLFLEIVFFGFYISIAQMELFTGFLWVLEGTIVFISMLLLFHLNVEGFSLKINLKINKYFYITGVLFFFLVYSCFFLINSFEIKDLQIFNIAAL